MKKSFVLFGLMMVALLASIGFAQEAADVAPVATDDLGIGAILTEYWKYIAAVVSIASVVANVTPNESDNAVVVFLNKLLGFFAANFNVKGIANK